MDNIPQKLFDIGRRIDNEMGYRGIRLVCDGVQIENAAYVTSYESLIAAYLDLVDALGYQPDLDAIELHLYTSFAKTKTA